MKVIIRISVVLSLLFLYGNAASGNDTLQYADLGDFTLESGQTIRDCRMAYRTFGHLNEAKSNAILFPTWLAGTTQELVDLGLIGPGKLADSSRYFVVAVDAFGNGVSSSPSNSKIQPEQTFPQFSIQDMVNAQHLLLTRYLQLSHLHGIIGISMGAMAAYQWMVSYPDFLDKAVAVVGSPRLTSYDRLLWQAELYAADMAQKDQKNSSTAAKTMAAIHQLHVRTPRYITENTTPDNFPQFLASLEEGIARYNLLNWAWQLKAIIGHDISKRFGKSMEQAAKAVHAKTLIVWAQQDLAVHSEPAQAFAKLMKSETFMLGGNCGHLAFLCEGEALRDTVKRFLGE